MNSRKIKRILIATGIYPPDLGGPAQYAYELAEVWKEEGYDVTVKYFSFEKKLPTIIRHFFYLFKSLPAIISSDYILVLDTWSAALPIAIGSMVFDKKFVIRTGGDFLWESYVERTKEKILLKDFYKDIRNFTKREKFILKVTKWILGRAQKIVFSTDWQRQIWVVPYNIKEEKTVIIENYYGEKIPSSGSKEMVFLGGTRQLAWKNTDMLKKVFASQTVIAQKAILDLKTTRYEEFIERIKRSYAVILASFGDVSPNMILDAIRCGKPFIVTSETGIYERIKDVAIFVDPLDADDITQKVLWLCDDVNYLMQKQKLESFTFQHSWKQIGDELLNIKI